MCNYIFYSLCSDSKAPGSKSFLSGTLLIMSL